VSQWAEFRHLHLVDGVPKKEIARRFELDVKTVRRALERSDPPSERRDPKRPRRLDGVRDEVARLLESEPRITAKRIGRVLGAKASVVGERALRKFVRSIRRELSSPEAFVHRTHAPGDTLEGDFFEAWARVAGSLCKARVFTGTLPCSNTYFAKAYPIERLECLLDGLNASFVYFGGLSRRAVLDNTSAAVKKILPGPEREETKAFAGWRGSLPLAVDFCAPASGNEKGSVERGNEYVRGLFFRPTPEAASWDELNAALLAELDRDLDLRKLRDGRTARQALHAEREHLRPLPTRMPESCRVVTCVADKYAIVSIDRRATRYRAISRGARSWRSFTGTRSRSWTSIESWRVMRARTSTVCTCSTRCTSCGSWSANTARFLSRRRSRSSSSRRRSPSCVWRCAARCASPIANGSACCGSWKSTRWTSWNTR